MNTSFGEDEVFPHTEMEDSAATNGHGVPMHWLHVQEASKYASIVSKSAVPNKLTLNGYSSCVRPEVIIPTDRVEIKSTVRHSSPAVLAANASISQSQFSRIRPMSSKSRLRLGLGPDVDGEDSAFLPVTESLDLGGGSRLQSRGTLRPLSPGGNTRLQAGEAFFGGGDSVSPTTLRPVSAGNVLRRGTGSAPPGRPQTAKLTDIQRAQIAGKVASLVEDVEFAREFAEAHPDAREKEPLELHTDTSSYVFQSSGLEEPLEGIYNQNEEEAFSSRPGRARCSSSSSVAMFSPKERKGSGAGGGNSTITSVQLEIGSIGPGGDAPSGLRRHSTASGCLESPTKRTQLPLRPRASRQRAEPDAAANKLLGRLIRAPPVPRTTSDGRPVYIGLDGSTSTEKTPASLPKLVNSVPANIKRDISFKGGRLSSAEALIQEQVKKTTAGYDARMKAHADTEAAKKSYVERQRAAGSKRGTNEFAISDHMTDEEILHMMPVSRLPGLDAADAINVASSSTYNRSHAGSASVDEEDAVGGGLSFSCEFPRRTLTFDEDDRAWGDSRSSPATSPSRRRGRAGTGSTSGDEAEHKRCVDEKLQAARQRRQEARELWEKQILEGKAERERKIILKQLMLQRSQMQSAWMGFVVVLKYFGHMSSALVEYRSHEAERQAAARRKAAVHTLERWWMHMKYKLLLKTHKRAALRMRICVRVFWKVIQIRLRRHAADLVKKFIHDTGRLGTTTQAIYRYRAAVKLAQRWVRGFLVCQQARMQLLYMAIVREEKRKHHEALHAIRMAELQKKARLRQIDGMKHCFGRAMVDHSSTDAGSRRMANTQENRIEMRLIKKQEKLANILEERAGKEEEFEQSRAHTQKSNLMRANAKSNLSISMPPFSQLDAEQRKHLARILANQRRYHLATFDALCKKVLSEQKYHVVEMKDVRSFLKYQEPEPEDETEKLPVHFHQAVKFKKNKDPGLGAKMKEKIATKSNKHHWELNREELQMPKLMETTLCLLTKNNCMKQLEAIPPEVFTPHNVISNPANKPVSILQRSQALSMLMNTDE